LTGKLVLVAVDLDVLLGHGPLLDHDLQRTP
jgi:hypothetical protein